MNQAAGLLDEVANAVCEFVEAAVHVVLHARGVYPPEAFERTRIYTTQTQRCRHPQVIEYIGVVVSKFRALLTAGVVTEVAVCLTGPQGGAQQRVILLLERLVLAPQAAAIDWHALAAQFTNALTKLQFLDNFVTSPPQPGSSWELQVCCRSTDGVDLTFWEQCPGSRAAAGSSHSGSLGQAGLQAVPFKTVDVPGLLRLQVLLEEPAQQA